MILALLYIYSARSLGQKLEKQFVTLSNCCVASPRGRAKIYSNVPKETATSVEEWRVLTWQKASSTVLNPCLVSIINH